MMDPDAVGMYDDDSYSGSESGSDSGSETGSDDSTDAAMRRAAAEKEAQDRVAAIAAAVSKETAAIETARSALKEREAVAVGLANEKELLQRSAAENSELHAKEIAKLRDTMTEGMQAVQYEKHAHTSTRMDAHDREARLEVENLAQAKALAAAQRALEEEVAKVMVARTKVEAKERTRTEIQQEVADLRKRLQQPQRTRDTALEAARALMSEGASIVEDLSRVSALIEQKEILVRDLEEQVAMAQVSRRQPSAVEKELDNRLKQLTDRLIQKQSQVEALQSEKATLMLRLETALGSLREEKAASISKKQKMAIAADLLGPNEDLEFGSASRAYYSSGKARPGRKYYTPDDFSQGSNTTLSSKLSAGARKLDSYALGATRFLRMNSSVRAFVLIYLLALHGWVLLVFLSPFKTPLSRSAGFQP